MPWAENERSILKCLLKVRGGGVLVGVHVPCMGEGGYMGIAWVLHGTCMGGSVCGGSAVVPRCACCLTHPPLSPSPQQAVGELLNSSHHPPLSPPPPPMPQPPGVARLHLPPLPLSSLIPPPFPPPPSAGGAWPLHQYRSGVSPGGRSGPSARFPGHRLRGPGVCGGGGGGRGGQHAQVHDSECCVCVRG